MDFLFSSFALITWKHLVMYGIGVVLIFLAIRKEYEPSLLLPMGFGAILVNLPLSGVLDQELFGINVQGPIQWLFETGIKASEIMPLLLFIGIGFPLKMHVSSAYMPRLKGEKLQGNQ